jgi:PAS domain S-box-containing protein
MRRCNTGTSFRSSARYPALLLGIAAVYFGAAKLGLTMAFVAEQVTIVWPPTGIALAAVIQLGYRVWPAIWLGAFLANATANEPVVTACGIAIGNTLEALAGAWLLRRVVGPKWDPERLKHVVGLIVLAALCSTTVSATIGTISLILGAVQPWRALGDIWWVWWVGDAISDLIIAPLLLAWVICRWRPSTPRVAEGICLLVLVVVTTAMVFIGPFALISSRHPLGYVVFPFVIWGALRFGQQGTTTVTFVASAVAIWGALHGSGPFATGNPHESLILLQLFMGTVAVSGLLLAAAVAERSRAEEALRESEERFRALANAAPAIVWAAAPDGTITFANAQWLRYCGLTPERNARNWPELVLHPDDRERCVAAWSRALQQGLDYEIEVRNRRHDGEYRWFLTRAVPVRDTAARIKEWFGTTTDIHDRKQIEDAVRRAHDELREANQAKDEFLATLGHELRNPLAAIANAIAVLQSGTPDDSAVALHSIIGRQAEQLSRLVDDLLDVARLTTGKTSLQRQPLDLNEAVSQCLIGLHRAGRTAQHRVTFHGSSAVVEGDRIRLEQVMSNLLDNALKYTPPGGSIRVTVQPEAGEAVLRVRDTGVGIPLQLLPRVFDLFTQAHQGPDRHRGGLGLGLALVRRLVELHGGRVTVHSEGPGEGSEFVVRFPLVPTAGEARHPARAAPQAPQLPEAGPRRVLLIEDHDDARASIRLLLETEGHQVEEAGDGQSGLEKLLALRPDIALVDVGLPGLDGYALAKAVRASAGGEDVYLVAMTGYGQAEDRRRAVEAGFDAHLVKPVAPEHLFRVVSAVRSDRSRAVPAEP